MVMSNAQTREVETVKNLIAELTPFEKENQEVISINDSSDIRIDCTDNAKNVFQFKYVAGELFLWAKAAKFWLSVNECQYMNDLYHNV